MAATAVIETVFLPVSPFSTGNQIREFYYWEFGVGAFSEDAFHGVV